MSVTAFWLKTRPWVAPAGWREPARTGFAGQKEKAPQPAGRRAEEQKTDACKENIGIGTSRAPELCCAEALFFVRRREKRFVGGRHQVTNCQLATDVRYCAALHGG